MQGCYASDGLPQAAQLGRWMLALCVRREQNLYSVPAGCLRNIKSTLSLSALHFRMCVMEQRSHTLNS